MVGFVKDITERKQAEKELQESEAKYKDLFESANDVVLSSDSKGNILEINARAVELTGFSRDELRSSNLLEDLIVPEDRAAIVQVLHDLVLGKNRLYEVRWAAKDGTVIDFEGSSSPRMSPDGKFISTRCILRDVSERKRAERALRTSEKRYRTLAEAAPDSIFIISRDDHVEYVNTHAARQFGLQPKDLIGKPREDFFPPEISDRQQAALQEVFKTGEPAFSEEKCIFGDREVWLGTWLVPLEGDTGQVNSVMGVARDITERKRAKGNFGKPTTNWTCE